MTRDNILRIVRRVQSRPKIIANRFETKVHLLLLRARDFSKQSVRDENAYTYTVLVKTC